MQHQNIHDAKCLTKNTALRARPERFERSERILKLDIAHPTTIQKAPTQPKSNPYVVAHSVELDVTKIPHKPKKLPKTAVKQPKLITYKQKGNPPPSIAAAA